jgi:transglutaminase-like putative cysteine protease
MGKKGFMLLVALIGILVYIGAQNPEILQESFSISDDRSMETAYELDKQTPTYPQVQILDPEYDNKPSQSNILSPGYSISSAYSYGEPFRKNTGMLTMTITNTGNNEIYVYGYGVRPASGNGIYDFESGYLIPPEEQKELGYACFDVPDKSTIKLEPFVKIMATSESGKWHDYGMQYFDAIKIETRAAAAEVNPQYTYNPAYLFDKINSLVNSSEPQVRSKAAKAAKEYPGKYNIYQVCALYDNLIEDVDYISDPRGSDYWAGPDETLEIGAGDCDDYAITMASLVEAIGGTSRIYLTETHAYAAVYIGMEEDIDRVSEAIEQYYGCVPVYYATDKYGCWLLLDPSAGMYAGSLPVETAPKENGWTYTRQTNVTVIDIVAR